MRLLAALAELAPAALRGWRRAARILAPDRDPGWLLKYNRFVEEEARRGSSIAGEMLGLLETMLRALVAAGVEGKLSAVCLYGVNQLSLTPLHWALLSRLSSETLRRAVDLAHDRISFPGETLWDDGATVWDWGETVWGLGAPEVAVALFEQVTVTIVVKQAAVTGAASTAPAPPTPETVRRSRRPTKMVRRVELVSASEAAAGWPSKTAKEALDLACKAASAREDDQVLNLLTVNPSTCFETWEGVQVHRQAAPGTPVAETLRELRRLRKLRNP